MVLFLPYKDSQYYLLYYNGDSTLPDCLLLEFRKTSTAMKSPSSSRHMNVKGVGYTEFSAPVQNKTKSVVVSNFEGDGERGKTCFFETNFFSPHSKVATCESPCAGDVGDCRQKAVTSRNHSTEKCTAELTKSWKDLEISPAKSDEKRLVLDLVQFTWWALKNSKTVHSLN